MPAGRVTQWSVRRARASAPARILLVALAVVAALVSTPRADQADQQAAPAPPAAQAPDQQPTPALPPGTVAAEAEQQPTFRGGITFVRVDVIVTDRKQEPIIDLKAEDFEVLEDGKPQAIEQFRLIRVDGNPRPGEPPPREIRTRSDEETEANRDDVRIFGILLDDYHVRRSNSIAMRATLQRFIQTQMRPNDLVSVMSPLTPVTDLAFTRNHDAIVGAVNRFDGVKFDYRPRNMYEETIARYPTEIVERIRNDITMGALRGLAVRLGSMREGRKSIIFVSEGFTAMLPPQLRRADASMPDNPFQQMIAAAGQDSPIEDTAAWFGQSDVFSRMRDVADLANRNNTAIYSLDPRGLTPFEFDIDQGMGTISFATDRRALQLTQDTLRSLSEQTDGRAFVNRNAFDQGLAQVVKDSSVYYLMGYNTSAPTDGKFHSITVRVKRRDVDVRARRGFWAASAEDAIRAAAPAPEVVKPVQTALASIATSVLAGKYVRTWVGTERGTGGKTKVTVLWEPLPAMGAAAARREPPGRLRVLAADASGNLIYRGRVPDADPAPPTPPTGIPATQRVSFEAPPGKTELRLTVEGETGGTLDSEIRMVDVPDLTAPQPALSSPRVHRARTARDVQAVLADGNAVPTAAREFSRTERLLIRFDAYAVGGETAEPTAVLLNRAGQKMSDVPVAAAKAGGTHQIDLGLNSVAAGEYLVEITLESGGGEASALVPFRIGT